MKSIVITFFLVFATSFTQAADVILLKKYAAEVPTQEVAKEVAGYIAAELDYTDSFQSDFTLAEFTRAGQSWYILDGYFTLKDGTILFLDFLYYPDKKLWRPIPNYAFVPKTEERLMLKSEKLCNPYARHFIGVVAFAFKEEGHLDELVAFFRKELGGRPALYSDGGGNLVYDLKTEMGQKPLFTLHEEGLIQNMSQLPYISRATLIPSGRNPSDIEITQTYAGVTPACIGAVNNGSTSLK